MEGLEELGRSGKRGQKKGFAEPYEDWDSENEGDLRAWDSLVTANKQD